MKLDKVLLAGILMGSGVAFAAGDQAQQTMDPQQQTQQLSEQQQQNWTQLDTNQDGYISRDEAAANVELSDAFQDQDQNADGQLSAEEFSSWEGSEQQQQEQQY